MQTALELRDWLNEQIESKAYENEGFLKSFLDAAKSSVKLVGRHMNNAFDLISQDPVVGPKWLQIGHENQELIFNILAAALYTGRVECWMCLATQKLELRLKQ